MVSMELMQSLSELIEQKLKGTKIKKHHFIHKYHVSEEEPSDNTGKFSYKVWQEQPTLKEKSHYVRDILKASAEERIPSGSHDLCQKGKVVSSISPIQRTAGMLVRPGGIKRSVWVLPPGSGKTCMLIDVISNFLDPPGNTKWKVFLVGDSDTFLTLKDELLKCPALYKGVPIRDLNSELTEKNNGLCTLVSKRKTNPDPDYSLPAECKKAPQQLENTVIFWLSYIKFGNLLVSHTPHGEDQTDHVHVAPFPKYERDTETNPYTANSVWIFDEFHKVQDPFGEDTSETWRSAAVNVGRKISTLNPQNPASPIIAGFTATPGSVVCMANIMKGRDPSIFINGKRLVDPRDFYDPRKGYVKLVQEVQVQAPWPHAKKQIVKVSQLQSTLLNNGCIEAAEEKEKTAGKLAVAIRDHPCVLSKKEVANINRNAYSLVTTGKAYQNLITLLQGLFFTVDTLRDSRYYGELIKHDRPCTPKEGYKEQIMLARKTNATWASSSNFTDSKWLVDYVSKCLEGQPHTEEDEKMFYKCAPKWTAIRSDLKKRTDLFGKTLIYLGAPKNGNCSSLHYCLGLAFFLTARHEWKNGFTPDSKPEGPSVYVVADNSGNPEVKLKKKKTDNSPEHQMMIMRTKNFRKKQKDNFNASPCAQSTTDAPPTAFSVAILDIGAKKALDFSCVNTMMRTVALNDIDDEQTKGRALRSCSFSHQPRDCWKMNLIDYSISTNNCAVDTYNCDCILRSWFCAQGQISRELLRLTSQVSLGCGNFVNYNKSGLVQPPPRCPTTSQHSSVCIYDKSDDNIDISGRDLFACPYIPTVGGTKIQPAVSGDITPELVTQTSTICKGVARESLSHIQHETVARQMVSALKHQARTPHRKLITIVPPPPHPPHHPHSPKKSINIFKKHHKFT
jgi:hypothetical protein